MISLTADVHLLSPAEGGRVSPIKKHYLTDWRWAPKKGELRGYLSAELVLLNEDELRPGDSSMATIRPLHPLSVPWWEQLNAGDEIGIFEGGRKVGTARIQSVDKPVEKSRS
jgi:hypothetical protein